ncbi:glycogen synthase GlgA [Propylenella binzhouense]|uniref:Glycogen synthase n=1 Tax=Propylenella binzhouense TaxID=2555902 RepID=A0A964T294_9HYPH|nr:glycogen synthase GlgA [Propylenella binzhouense]MYZ46930.1 glycogen synthase GlgA [Propylenella binzhouense]
MQALSVVSEIYPLVKTGGLADVAGALPAALAREGISVSTLVPGYPAVMRALDAAGTVHAFDHLFGGPARLLAGRAAGLALFVLDAPHLFDRPGNPYLDRDGRDWPDNARRFAALAQVGALLGRGLAPGFDPAIVHAHDWQAGLVPALLHFGGGGSPGTVATVHNLAFQGVFPAEIFPALGLPPAAFAVEGIEFFGQVGFLKAALQFADRITTVSPTYAREILTPEHGMQLDGVLRARADRLSGILNGIDGEAWNPEADPHLPKTFDVRRTIARRVNKRALQERFGLPADAQAMLCAVVSRLSWQKGLDILLAALPRLAGRRLQLALVGTGDADLEAAFRSAAERDPKRVGVVIGYDEALAHLVQGGADAVLVPSRFEPCGLTQLCAMRYGALPIVARVGGLADTVVDANEMALAMRAGTGFQFSPPAPGPLAEAIERALAVWADPAAWRRLQRNAMGAPVGWERPAARYAELYRSLASERAPEVAAAPAAEPEGAELE